MRVCDFHFGKSLFSRTEAWRFLLLGIFIGMIVFIGAVDWVGSDVVYSIDEDSPYYHNLSVNVTGFNSEITFDIDTQTDVNWTNASGSYLVPATTISDWLFIENSVTGNLSIDAEYDNQTGFFIVPIQASNASGDDTITNFEFQIDAVNDLPNFTNINSSYDFPQAQSGTYTINAIDEEEHYPLNFNLTFLDNNCTHAFGSGRADNENCSLYDFGFNLTGITSTSINFNFTNPGFNDVGTYWANFSVTDFNGTCPHEYCNVSDYEKNKSSDNYILKFNVYSSLTVNVTNCSGATVTEGDTFNCTINITTRGDEDALDFSSYAFFSANPSSPYDGANRDWFYSSVSDNASNFFYSLPISITPEKNEVGNWTINFTVLDTLRSNSKVEQIEIFVNFSEAGVSLDPISNLTLYTNGSFAVNAYDNDLLIWDADVKDEVLTFSSNTSWVTAGLGVDSLGNNYSTSTISIDYSYALDNLGVGNYSVMINASDLVGNLDSEIFVVEVLNETAPEWNITLDNPVVLNLTEGSLFSYNVSVNVSDPEGDQINFYYINVSEEFCSLTSSNFNSSSGIINFIPTDCDVGFHNVSIVASDTKLNSSWIFVFNISNIVDAPSIASFSGYNSSGQFDLTEGFNFASEEGVRTNFTLVIDDYDFLIPEGQKTYYNESLDIDIIFTNSTGSVVDMFNFTFDSFGISNPERASYEANFTAGVEDVGNYTVFVNVSDFSGAVVNRSWSFNITESLDAPVLDIVYNASLTIHGNLNFSLNATDDEDDFFGLNLNYSIAALDSGAPDLVAVGAQVEFNMSSNQSYGGLWTYNVSVNDSDGLSDWQLFYLSVYSYANLISPSQGFSFSVSENVSSILNFTINHSVGDNLTYEFWIDNVSCPFQNNSNCSYGNLTFRESVASFGNGSSLNWSFVSSFLDESYDLEKNLTVRVYPNSSLLDSNQSDSVAVNFSFKLNVSHTNAPMRKVADLGILQSDYNSNIEISLDEYFSDEDVTDSYYLQNVTFEKSSGDGDIFVTHSGGWTVQIGTTLKTVHDGSFRISGSDNLTSDITELIQVKFVEPTVVSVPTSGGGGGSSTKLKFYSLRIIVPEDVIISDEDYIEIPFGLENTGTIDLSGIDLGSSVLYNNEFADDVKIDLGVSYLDSLKSGEKKDYTMRILADTDRSGRYKATISANISSPKFFDWGDFFIDLRRVNESEAEELLVFTEKIIADNPECLELTEVFRRAKEMFEAGNQDDAVILAEEVSAACEDAISANEQIRYRIEGFVERNFYYISFMTLSIFFIGFIAYVYKRVRFNRIAEDEYVH